MSDDSPQGLRHRLRQLDRLWSVLTTHLTWVVGLAMLADAIYVLNWTSGIVEHPRFSLALFGLLLLTTGREAVGYRKKYRRMRNRAERYEEYYEEVREAYGGLA